MSRARTIADFGDGIATADIDDGAITSGKLASGAITSGALPAGTVLQVVQFTSTSVMATTSTSLIPVSLSGTITPSSSSNKILIQLNGGDVTYGSGVDRILVHLYAKIGSGSFSDITGQARETNMNSTWGLNHSISYLYSPSTTEVVTVTPYIRSNGGNTVYFNNQPNLVSLTLMEIAG